MRINQLKHELYLRTKIARDLHDDVGSTLSSLHMVSALARKKITDDPAKTKELLEKITESSERMTGNMQDIVWAVNPLNDSFSQIIARMQKFAAQMLELKNIELVFDADEKIKSIKVPLQYRSDLFMIFKEAVNNLAKYSNAHHAWISLYKLNKNFFLQIKDDGVGFDVQNVSKGNGLRNMQERAKNLNGKLNILSDKSGTKITLEFSA
jgi:signal transduction histidine kinase